jgi:2-phospho-L-lactate guanylyltransferase
MGARSGEEHDAAVVVIPLRSFAEASTRLAPALTPDARAALARTMADRVHAAAAPLRVVVVSSAPEVLAWAAGHGCTTLPDPGSLDAAADAGRRWARAHEYSRVVIVHADLPLAESLADVAVGGDARIAVIVPDHRNDGTPVLALPTDVEFPFAYGPGSAARHIAAARACGLEVRVLDDPALAFDVDTPADLDALRAPDGSAP